MLIAGILISPKAHMLVSSKELSMFLKTYVAVNIEGVDPAKLDVKFLADNLRQGLDSAFHTQFSVISVDAQTGDPVDDLTVAAALEVSTELNVPSIGVH